MQVGGTTPLWAAARVLLRERRDDFFRRRDKVLATFDPEDIHDLRVSSRRLREGLALFAPCYPRRKMARLLKGVRGVTRLLGEIRNRDEAALFFSSLSEGLDAPCRSEVDGLVAVFRDERQAELQRLGSGLRRMAGKELRRLSRRAIDTPRLLAPAAGGTDPFAPLAVFARQALDARLDDVLRLVPQARQLGNMEAQHLLRIGVKHFRYRLEILAPLFGDSFRPLHATVKGYQELLGTMHDLDVFAGLCRTAPFGPATSAAVLAAIAAQREREFSAFSTLLADMPFEKIGERMRDAL
jgi:CHAD domain-containing protein